jgi:hypothetical protein
MPYRDPDRSRDYHRQYRRLRRAGESTTPCQTAVPTEFRLRTAADVLAMLEEQVEAVRHDPESTTIEKARTIGFLANVVLRAIEAGNIAARLEALEAALRRRGESS